MIRGRYRFLSSGVANRCIGMPTETIWVEVVKDRPASREV